MAEVAHPANKAPAPTGPAPTNGLAIAALVVGIVAFISGWAPFWGFIAGVTAVVLGILGLRKPGLKGMSIAGLVTGAVGALWSLVVSAFFILAIVSVGIGGAALEQGIREGLDEYNAETRALIDAKKDFAKGETAVFEKLEVTVNSVQRGYEHDSSFVTPGEGKEFILVNVTVKNTGDESKYVSSYDFGLNEGGVSTTASFYEAKQALKSGNLSADASTTGNIVYEVTDGAEGLKLQYETTVYDLDGGLKKLVYTLAI